MNKPTVAPYGSWKSPIQARQIVEGTIRLSEVLIDGECIYWTELRPTEGGRCVVIRRSPDGRTIEMIPAGFNARTRVHEYGGGAFLPDGESVLFINFTDQRLYRATGRGKPEPVTPAADLRYADLVPDGTRARLIAVQEDHRGEGEAVNTLAAIYPQSEGRAETLVSGNDFYAAPRISPDGSQLAWLTWNHPDMPWDAAELWLAPVREDGSLGGAVHVAGGPGEAVVQPEWSPDGVLHFVFDRSDWWNLYRWRDGQIERLTHLAAEFALPQWRFRMSTYGFDGPARIVCTYTQDGLWHLAALDLVTGELKPIATPYNTISHLQVTEGQGAFIGGSAGKAAAVVRMDLATGEMEELRRASELAIDPGYISVPEAVEFPTTNGLTAHGLFYAPKNKDHTAPADERPPLVILVHSGPTAATSASLRLGIQYYTSRGLAVLDVNYGGSTGYGRKYRERLYGRWGVVDVDDCCNGARFLADRGRVDGGRLAITGGSAGGYTTLACLAFRDVFAAGASHYGVSDCEALAQETHKFESRYLDRLIGPYPEQRERYLERSPIHHTDGLSCPVAFFQGLDDPIVPPNQAQMMADALRKKGLPVAHVEFEGEQHGFRRAENMQRALEGELYFFSRIFGFDLADPVPPLEIDNL